MKCVITSAPADMGLLAVYVMIVHVGSIFLQVIKVMWWYGCLLELQRPAFLAVHPVIFRPEDHTQYHFNPFSCFLNNFAMVLQQYKYYGPGIQNRRLTAYNDSMINPQIHRILFVSLCLLTVCGGENCLCKLETENMCRFVAIRIFAGAIQLSLNSGRCGRAGDLRQRPVCANEYRPLFSGIQFRLPTSCSVDRTQPQPAGTRVLRYIILNTNAWSLQWLVIDCLKPTKKETRIGPQPDVTSRRAPSQN